MNINFFRVRKSFFLQKPDSCRERFVKNQIVTNFESEPLTGRMVEMF